MKLKVRRQKLSTGTDILHQRKVAEILLRGLLNKEKRHWKIASALFSTPSSILPKKAWYDGSHGLIEMGKGGVHLNRVLGNCFAVL